MPSGSRYAKPAKPQLNNPVRKVILRPRRSASGPEISRVLSATKEKTPITRPTVWSEPPRSYRMCGPSSGSTVPIPRNPRKVAPIKAQKRPVNRWRSDDPIYTDCTDALLLALHPLCPSPSGAVYGRLAHVQPRSGWYTLLFAHADQYAQCGETRDGMVIPCGARIRGHADCRKRRDVSPGGEECGCAGTRDRQ